MNPEITVIASLITLFEAMTQWPIAMMLFALLVGPWILSLILGYSARKRFETVVSMYNSNVKLVESYEELSKDLKDVVMVNTQTFATLTEAIKNNQFCPMVREKGGTK